MTYSLSGSVSLPTMASTSLRTRSARPVRGVDYTHTSAMKTTTFSSRPSLLGGFPATSRDRRGDHASTYPGPPTVVCRRPLTSSSPREFFVRRESDVGRGTGLISGLAVTSRDSSNTVSTPCRPVKKGPVIDAVLHLSQPLSPHRTFVLVMGQTDPLSSDHRRKRP